MFIIRYYNAPNIVTPFQHYFPHFSQYFAVPRATAPSECFHKVADMQFSLACVVMCFQGTSSLYKRGESGSCRWICYTVRLTQRQRFPSVQHKRSLMYEVRQTVRP